MYAKLFYNIYTMNLGRCSLLFETKNIRLICKIWLPKMLTIKAYNRFMLEFSEYFNKRSLDQITNSRAMKLFLYNRVNNLYPSLYNWLLLMPDKEAKEFFRELFLKDYENAEDLYLIKNEIKRLSKKLKALLIEPVKETETKFSDIIANVQMITGATIDRKMKLYEFKSYFDKARETIDNA